jgi:pimeloyl-ACP methyl ester carboxylesterase
MDFPLGSRQLHHEPNFNYQLNRLALWNGGDWDELAQAAKRINNAADWEREIILLGEKALADGRLPNAAGYFRMAEFFMFEGNPEKLKVYYKAKDLFERLNWAVFESGEVKRERVSYMDSYLPVWAARPDGKIKDTILLHGGFDSYIEEFYPVIRYLVQNGYAAYLFEGPGQGETLRSGNLRFTHEWHKPVGAVLDHFGLDNVTLVGISLGGVLAPRAAAFEKRIHRVVGYSILPNLYDVFLSRQSNALRNAISAMLSMGQRRLLNHIAKGKLSRNPMLDWQINHAMYAFGTKTIFELLLELKKYCIADIGGLIEQDFLLLGAGEDHFIPPSFYKDVIDALPNARSLTYRLFTEKEYAGTHCSAGNVKLVLDFIDGWITSVKGRETRFSREGEVYGT